MGLALLEYDLQIHTYITSEDKIMLWRMPYLDHHDRLDIYIIYIPLRGQIKVPRCGISNIYTHAVVYLRYTLGYNLDIPWGITNRHDNQMQNDFSPFFACLKAD